MDQFMVKRAQGNVTREEYMAGKFLQNIYQYKHLNDIWLKESGVRITWIWYLLEEFGSKYLRKVDAKFYELPHCSEWLEEI